MNSSAGRLNSESSAAQIKRLVLAQLKSICKRETLPVSGPKAVLQTRILTRLDDYATQNEEGQFSRLKALIQSPEPSSTWNASPNQTLLSHNSKTSTSSNGEPFSGANGGRTSTTIPPTNFGTPSRPPLFITSPFYTLLEALTPVLECKVREATRDSVQATINLRPELAASMNKDSTKRVMILCAEDNGLNPFSRVNVAFPYQVEIKVNQDEVKTNLRGLKNRPGTTRPADITDLLRKRTGYRNEIVVTYALTQKRFLLTAFLVQQHPVNELVSKLKAGKTISKERVIREIQNKAQDVDIQATSMIMSLKCPLSTLRIEVPCRSTLCNHNQCFDATSFLLLQEQAPTWTCPLCNVSVSFESLMVDEYVNDILLSTSSSIDQVTVEPNGRWSLKPEDVPKSVQGMAHANEGAEDDLVELADTSRIGHIKSNAMNEESMLRTPPTSSREPSSSLGPQSSGTLKRSTDQIIDLTASSDDENYGKKRIHMPKRRTLSSEWSFPARSSAVEPLSSLSNISRNSATPNTNVLR